MNEAKKEIVSLGRSETKLWIVTNYRIESVLQDSNRLPERARRTETVTPHPNEASSMTVPLKRNEPIPKSVPKSQSEPFFSRVP